MQPPRQHQAEIMIEEDLRAIVAWADEGGQHEGWPGEGRVLALQRVAATPTSGAQSTTLRKQLPPLMRTICYSLLVGNNDRRDATPLPFGALDHVQ
jgi:hypothetical protein